MPQKLDANERLPIHVWDPLVRLFHWSLALSFGFAWLSAHSWDDLHCWAGYFAGALILARLVWGFIGSRYARFSQFVRPPRTVLGYLRTILEGRERRYVGHNPAGGAMVIALMLAMASTALTGLMLTTDVFWGVTWVQKLHDLLAHGLLLLVCVHLAGVLLASFRHRENLIFAMINGQKRAGEPRDVV